MNQYGMARVLTALDQAGLGKRVTQGLIQKATQKIMSGDADTDKVQAFYEDFWKHKGVPQEIQDKLVDDYRLPYCEKCHHPIFENQTGQSGNEYCSEDCMDEADDRPNENLRDCEQCGESYDCEYDGYWVLGEESVCSRDCAWDYLENSRCYSGFFRDHPNADESATMEGVKRNNAPNYDNCREFQNALEEYAVYLNECAECGDTGPDEDGHRVDDIDGGWFCDEECAWKAINDYVANYVAKEYTGLAGPTQVQTLVRENHQLYDLEDRRDLDRAIDDAVSEIPEEEEEE